jgi:hypothetical protein
MAAGGDARRQAGGTEQPAERRLWRKFRVVSERPQLADSTHSASTQSSAYTPRKLTAGCCSIASSMISSEF